MAVKLPANVAYFTNIRFNKLSTHHDDPNTKLIQIQYHSQSN